MPIYTDTDIQSLQVKEVLGKVPPFIIYWGTSIIFITLLIMIIVSCIVKYPDIISARIVINTMEQPLVVVAPTSGNIDVLLAKEGDILSKNDTIAILENSAHFQHVQYVKNKINNFDPLKIIDLPLHLQLGEMQDKYANFLKSYEQYHFALKQAKDTTDINAIQHKILKTEDLLTQQLKQKYTHQEEIKMIEKNYNKYEILKRENVVSDNEIDNILKELLQAQKALNLIDVSISNTKINIDNLNIEITNAKKHNTENKQSLYFELDNQIKQLTGAIQVFEKKYTITAPFSGRASFFDILQKGQYVQQGEEIMTIIPTQNDSISGNILVPMNNFGKIQINQRVNVKLDAYPFQEYGIVKAKIIKISAIPKDDMYVIEVIFPNLLTTSHNKELNFKQGMQGVADIITHDMSLMQRFLHSFIYN